MNKVSLVQRGRVYKILGGTSESSVLKRPSVLRRTTRFFWVVELSKDDMFASVSILRYQCLTPFLLKTAQHKELRSNA